MDSDQTVPKGGVWPGFIVFALSKNILECIWKYMHAADVISRQNFYDKKEWLDKVNLYYAQ